MIRDRYHSMNKFRKRVFAVALATAVASTSFNIGSIAVNAGTSARGRVIVEFEELPEDIAEQTLPIGGKKSDINFPEELDVLLYSEDEEEEEKTTESVEKLEEETEPRTEESEERQEETEETPTESEEEAPSETDNTDEGVTEEVSEAPSDEDAADDTATVDEQDNSNDDSSNDDGAGDDVSDEGDNSDDSGNSEDTEGKLLNKAVTGLKNTFVPVKAYADELDSDEEEPAEEEAADDDTDKEESEEASETASEEQTSEETTEAPTEEPSYEEPSEEETEEATEEASSEQTTEEASEETTEAPTEEKEEKVRRLGDGEPRTLEDVRWKLDRDKSEYGSRFQAVRAGDVFYFVPDIKAYGLKSEVDLPEIRVTIVEEEETVSDNSVSEDSISDNTISENSVSENGYPEFDQFMIVDGVKVRVTAPEGVFPEDSTLRVKKIDDAESNAKIEEAVKEDMGLSDSAVVNGDAPDSVSGNEGEDEEGSSAPSGESLKYISFDITITDVSGNEIQPVTENGEAMVEFSQADIISEYVEAPGEETEGKLGSGTDDNEGSEDDPETESGGSGKVYILNGDEDEEGSEDNNSKKTLRVYHFDDDLGNIEKKETYIDEDDSSVAVEADHFSPWTIAYSNTASSEIAGPFKFTGKGAEFVIKEIDAYGSSPKQYQVTINTSSSSDGPELTIEMKDKGSSTNCIISISGNESGVPNYITLKGIKIDTSHSEPAFKFTGYGNRYRLYLDGENNIYNSRNVSLDIQYNDLEINSVDGTKNGKLTLRSNGDSLYGNSGINKASSVTVNSGTLDCERFGNNIDNVTINGGFVTVAYGVDFTHSGKKRIVNGGTHSLHVGFFPHSNPEGGKNTSEINGGNVELTGYMSWVGLHILTGTGQECVTRISLGADHANEKVTGIYIGKPGMNDAASPAKELTEYGLEDCYINDKGELWIWRKSKDKTSYLPDGDIYVYWIQTEKGTYVNKNGAFVFAKTCSNSDATPQEEFSPYDPMLRSSLSVNTVKIKYGNNTLSENTTYTATNDTSQKYPLNGHSENDKISYPFRDIKWVISENGVKADSSKAEITQTFYPDDPVKGTEDATLNLKKNGLYILKAQVYDKVKGMWEKEFTVRYLLPVHTIKISPSSNITIKAGENNTLSQAVSSNIATLDVTRGDETANKINKYTFTVDPSDSTNKEITWSVTKNGSAVSGAVNGNTTLKIDVAGDYELVATIKDGLNSGDYVQKFKLTAESIKLTDSMVKLEQNEYPYTGEKINAKVKVTDGGKDLTEGKDYSLSYKNNVKVAKSTDTDPPTVTVKGIGKYEGTVDKTFTITANVIKASEVTLDKTTYSYTGSAIEPKETVSYNGKTLIKGVDYTVLYDNNTGSRTAETTATVTITGTGIYTGTVTKTFTITPNVIKDTDVTLAKTVYGYTGKEVTPEVTVSYNGKPLTKDTDYTVTYSDNINEGNATVTVTGTGIYTGTVNKTFRIKKLPTGSITIAGQTYDSFEIKDAVGKYVNEVQSATITAKAATGETLDNIEYFVSSTFYPTKDMLENEAKDKWKKYSLGSRPKLVKDSRNYIYARLTDGEGDHEYLSTKDIIEDETAPSVSIDSISVGASSGSAMVSGEDSLSGIAKYYLLVKKKGGVAPSAPLVKKKGISSNNGVFKVPSISNANSYMFYAVTEDKAGNLSKVASEGYYASTTASIKVLKFKYTERQSIPAIDGYTRKPNEITITASNGKGIKKIEYFISDQFYASNSEIEEGAKKVSGGWSEYTGPKPCLKQNQLNYIYARITSNAGTDKEPDYFYVSSRGIWEDEIKPEITDLSVSAADKSATVKVTGKDNESGISTYYLLVKKHGETAPKTDEIMKKGLNNTTGNFSVKNLKKGAIYDYYAVITDKAGNVSAIKKVSAPKKHVTVSANIEVDKFKYDLLQGRDLIEETYYNKPQEIKITAKGASKIQYFITNKFYSSESEIENAANPKNTKTLNTTENTGTEVDSTYSKWSTYNDKSRPYLKKNMINYIYAKVTDAGGNVEYISSHGIWEDEIKPKVTSIKTTPKDKSADGVVKGKDNESGIKFYYLLVKKSDDAAPKKPEDVQGGMKSEDGKFDLTGLTPKTKYSLYAVIEDKAGNLSDIKKGIMTTKKDTNAANKAAAAGAGKGAGAGSGTGSGSNVDKRTAGQNGSGSASGNSASGNEAVRDGVPYIEDASEGILIGRDKTSGWDRIEGEVGKATAPAQVFVNMNGGTEVPAEALKKCEDRDVTYYFLMNDDITWTVNGLSFTEPPKTIDFRVRTDTKNIPSKLVNEIADVYPHTNLTLEHNGDFGFTAILSINVGKDNEGMYANLYYYDEEKNSLEFQESVEVDGSGRASFNFLHASDYTVILRGDALTDKTAAALAGDISSTGDGFGNGSGGPVNVTKNTGNLWLLIVSIISFLLCGFILFAPDKKKRRGYAGA